VFASRLEAILEFPDNELMRELHQTPYFLCDAPSRTMAVGHFYPDAADITLTLVVYLLVGNVAFLGSARQLLQQVLTVSAAESRGTS